MERYYDFEMKGVTALLFHADDVEESDRLREWRQDPSNKNFSVPGDDRSPPWTWTTYLYPDPASGLLAWPSANLMVGFRQAGAQLILKRQKTFKEITQSGMGIYSEFLEFFCRGKPVRMEDINALVELPFKDQAAAAQGMGFRLYVKRAKVGQSKHVRVRARFDDWSVRGRLAVLAPEITEEVLVQLAEIAGRGGQGDWRPACKTPGSFGMFSMKLKRVPQKGAA